MTSPAHAADAAAIAALQARGRFGIRLGLGRTRALLRALGSPEAALRGALIGGTNGKGSTGALVSSVLGVAGVRVGQTPKPHLVDYRERIVVDGQPIAADAFAALLEEVLGVSERLPRRLGPPTEFEVLTAAALLWFARVDVRVAVVEVGLGGRLDATNAWAGGVAAVTNVERDHMEYLGETIGAIAREKAAIIKRGDLAVTGARGEALAIIRRRASRVGARLRVATPLPVERIDRGGTWLRHPTLGILPVGLLGRHQGTNAAVALAILEALDEAGFAHADADTVRRGLESARWPGRLELMCLWPDGRARPTGVPGSSGPAAGHPDVLLDGAHNAAGAVALATSLDDLAPLLSPGRPVLLLGIMRDKEVTAVLDPLARSRLLRGARVITTTVPDTPRALPASALAAAWGAGAEAVESLAGALDRAVGLALAGDGPLVVAGSLYLVGAVRSRILAVGSRPEGTADGWTA